MTKGQLITTTTTMETPAITATTTSSTTTTGTISNEDRNPTKPLLPPKSEVTKALNHHATDANFTMMVLAPSDAINAKRSDIWPRTVGALLRVAIYNL